MTRLCIWSSVDLGPHAAAKYRPGLASPWRRLYGRRPPRRQTRICHAMLKRSSCMAARCARFFWVPHRPRQPN